MKSYYKHLTTLAAAFLLLFLFNPIDAQERREEGNMVLQGVPEIPQEVKDRIQQYQNSRSAGLADWLPNGEGMLIRTRFGNTGQFHIVDAPKAARQQITFYDEPVRGGSFCPSDEFNGFMFSKDVGGNEYSQLFWYDMDKRKAEMISDGESVNFGLNWSNKGDQFAFTSTRRNTKDFDVYISKSANMKEAELILDKGNGYWIVSDWSPDDSKLIVINYLSATKSNSFIYDLNSKELTQINDPDEEAIFLASDYDKKGEKIYVVTNKGREFQTLALYDPATKDIKILTGDIPWDVQGILFDENREKAVFTVNENGYDQLYTFNVNDYSYSKIEGMPKGQSYGYEFHPTKNELAFAMNTSQTSGDIYSMSLDNFEMTRWTYSEVGGLNTSTFPEPELIHYETFDEVDGKKRKIPAFVYKPKAAEGPYPVVVSIHGGPESQHRPNFSSFYAYMANELGIAIIAPNVRGSEGYGKSYLQLDNGYKREDSVKDIGMLLDWIGENPEFDGERIAVMGGSYGGYMVLASMFHFNDKIKCGIDIVGISNFVTFLKNTKEYRQDLRRVEYGDERDPEMHDFLNSISPNNHVDEIKAPLFIIQGANDPRVPASESDQMVDAIVKNGGDVWYMLAMDEGHGFRKKENRDKMTEAIALFLQEFLIQ